MGQACVKSSVAFDGHELTYFDIAARAEPARVALFAAGVPWKDTRINGEQYAQAKKEGKYATGLPSLRCPSGRTYCQSVAMVRYASKLGNSGLYPSDPEAAMF